MIKAPPAMLFPREEYVARWARVAEAMAARGHETLIIWQRGAGTFDRVGNVYWLTNFTTFGTGQDPPEESLGDGGYTFSAVLFRGGEPELHYGQPEAETDSSRIVCGKMVNHAAGLIAGLADYLKTAGIEGKVAVVGDDILPGRYDRLLRKLTPQIDWVADESLLAGPQKIKSACELEIFRQGGAIATSALSAMMEVLVAGGEGAEAAARAAEIIVRAGGGFHRLDVCHGPRSEHYLLSNDFYGYDRSAPASGDMVRAWLMGPIYGGYWLDPGRSAVCGGKPNAAQRAILEGSAEIVDTICAAIRPGITPRELGILAEPVARRVGYFESRETVALFGHGLGTFFESHPIPVGDPGPDPDGAMGYDLPLQPGMVIAAEAFLRGEGVGLAGFEENLIVTDDGAERLTQTPMRYW